MIHRELCFNNFNSLELYFKISKLFYFSLILPRNFIVVSLFTNFFFFFFNYIEKFSNIGNESRHQDKIKPSTALMKSATLSFSKTF